MKPIYKDFTVVFETVSRKPITRTVTVSAQNEQHAAHLVSQEFDTFKFSKDLFTYIPTGKHIKIKDVKAIEE